MSATDYIAVLGGLIILALIVAGIWSAIRDRRERREHKGKPKDRTRYPPWASGGPGG